jgi:HSP20 family protein
MTQSEWKPMRVMLDLERELEQAFAAMIDEPWGRIARPTWHPAVDIHETDTEYIVVADLPGIQLPDIDVHVETHEVTVCGTRTHEQWTQTSNRVRLERASGRFCRTFRLERAVDPKPIATEYGDGVLIVRLQKLTGRGRRQRTEEHDAH